MDEDNIVGRVRDRHGNEYAVRFFKNSSDFPECHILTHECMNGHRNLIDDSKETVRFTKEIWDNIGYEMGWKRKKKIGE